MKKHMREVVLFLLLLALPVGSYVWVFKPTNDHIAEQRQAIDAKAEKLSQLRDALSGIEDLDAEVSHLQDAVTFFENKLPADHEIHLVLDEVARIAERHHLETKIFKTMAPKQLTQYSEQPIQLEVESDFDGFYQFLLDVEKMARLTRVKQMHIKRVANEDGMIEAKLTMSIYFAQG